MKRILLGVCGAALLGLTAFSSGANAMPLTNAAPLGLAQGESAAPVENVGWRTVCRSVPRWYYGRPTYVERCRQVWVDRGWGGGGWGGGGYGPRPGFYGAPPPPPPPAWGYGYGRGW
ncbi:MULTISPECIES: hypothetical protein [Azorhizobium]|uniref:hypothetical protein n=1 Tax=Azorhizobium TaxID=6 RepID=UPI00105F78F7|nr:hypothetical protein [Azorhizobium sp. AG788]TDT99209.1 hypothetical protein DFO45_0915 [Azorhizobium sp. AG788]